MKAIARVVLAALIASAGAVLSVAVYVPAADAQAAHIRWDIAGFSPGPPGTLVTGGADSALADDATGITLTGSGNFVAPAGEAGSSGAATGGGTWQTFDKMGIPTGNGTYRVSGLVRWDEAPGTLDGAAVDGIAPQYPTRAGLVVLRVQYSDGDDGVLIVSCALVGSPPGIFEGITASKSFLDYWNRIPGLTLFHALR